MHLKIDFPVYIKDAEFFEIESEKRKPTFVSGRNFYSLTYRHKGEITVLCDGKEFVSVADTVTFIPKGVSYTTEVLADTHICGAHFDLLGDVGYAEAVVIPVKNPTLRALFLSLSQKNEGVSAQFSRLATLYEILAALTSYAPARGDHAIPQKIAKVKTLIEDKFRDPFLSIERLADQIKVSETYLRRAFRAAYGISPMRYLKNVRTEQAKRLLLTASMSVARIAEECGYTSTSYFIQDFHKAVGRSPGEYRAYMEDTP